MARKQILALVAFAALAATGTAARADDITIANEAFMSTKTRAEVCDEVVQAHAAGFRGVSEVDLSPTMAAQKPSTLTRDQVRASLDEPGVLRVDARPAPFYQGRIAADAAHARGTLPGAVNLDSENWFELGSAALMDKAALQDEADKLNAAPSQPIIAFCNAGHWSATDWFVLSEVLGRPGVRMYPGSIIDWTSAPAPLPMDNEPGRWQQLRYAALAWAHRNLGTPAP